MDRFWNNLVPLILRWATQGRHGPLVWPLLCRPIKDDDPVLIMMFSRRLSRTDSQMASLGTECNQNSKVCVYRLQRLLSFVGLLYSSIKVRSICLIILQTLTLYQQFFPDWPRRSQAKNCCFRMRILHLSFFIVEIVKLFGAICMVLGKTLQFIWPLICQRSWNKHSCHVSICTLRIELQIKFRTTEPLGERRYENRNTHTHTSDKSGTEDNSKIIFSSPEP